MSWVKVDDKAWAHPKFAELSGNAVRLWLFALCWCNQHETDGAIPRGSLRLLSGSSKDVAELVRVGLWHETERGWAVHDFLTYQPSKAQRNAQREATASRVQRHRGSASNGHTRPPVTPLHERDQRVGNTAPGPIPARPDPENPSGSSCIPTSPRELATEPKPKSPRKKPRSAIPTDWQPLERHRNAAAERGIDVDFEAKRFRAHAEANDRRAVEWNRAFDSWLLNERVYVPRGGVFGSSGGFDPFERAKRLREAEEREQMAFTAGGTR